MLQVSINKPLQYFDLEVDFTVSNHQILVVWGPSGAGKTTVLECLAGLRTPASGTIELNHKPLYSSESRINLVARDRQVGYLFQDYALFPHMTVEQNVKYGLRSKTVSQQVDHRMLLESFGILHLRDRYPGQLSGGEKQRTALVRALVVQPRLLLLDEPFSALDQDSKSRLRQEIKNLQKTWEIPMVLVTHDKEDALALGDIMISLDQGRMISHQNTREKRKTGLENYQKANQMVGIQF